MSKTKKKEDESLDEEQIEKKDSKKDLKEKIKNPSKKTSKQKKEDVKKEKKKIESEDYSNLPLKTLIDLVNESGIRRKEIIVLLADNGYLGQFYEEEDKRKIGYPVKPTITEKEFKKIIGE